MAISKEAEELRRQIEFERQIMNNMGMAGLGQTSTTSIFDGRTFRPAYEFETTPHTMLYHASVEKAENGFILKVTHKQGETPKIYVAKDTEELQRVFIAAIVGERISK